MPSPRSLNGWCSSLWGSMARRKRALIDGVHHTVIESAHPSPLSAHNGFFGSRPFVGQRCLHRGRAHSVDHRSVDWQSVRMWW